MRSPHETSQILPVTGLGERLGEPQDLLGVDIAYEMGDLLDARHLQAMPGLDGTPELGGLQPRTVGPGVEPRVAAAALLHWAGAAPQIHPAAVVALPCEARQYRNRRV